MSHIDKLVVPKEEIKLENKENFKILCVKPSNIENLDWNNPDYLNALLNQDFYESYSVKPEDFVESVAVCLKINEYDGKNVKTQIIYEDTEHIYEISYIEFTKDKMKKEWENQMGSLININGDKIYGNIMIYKSYVPLNSKNMLFHDMTKEDLYKILYHRASSKAVVYEDENWSERYLMNNIQDFSDKLFEDEKYKVKKVEIPFLMHNINIWYVISEYGEENVCGKIINHKMEKCFWFSRLTSQYLCNLTLDEVKKIIFLSDKLDNYETDSELLKDEKDDLGRNVVKNKYRILENMYNKFKN